MGLFKKTFAALWGSDPYCGFQGKKEIDEKTAEGKLRL